MLAERPDSAETMNAFLDILAQSMQFPAKAPIKAAAALPQDTPQVFLQDTPQDKDLCWIPVLGRSAAGVPHFWRDPAQAESITQLRDLAERHARQVAGRSQPARITQADDLPDGPVQIISVSRPQPGQPSQFLLAETILKRWPDAFAVQIDGESMSPDIRHGDFVVLSPSTPAGQGRPAVVQLDNQIGVTCKLYHTDGSQAHLVPINEHFEPQAHPAKKITWALQVLARIRPE